MGWGPVFGGPDPFFGGPDPFFGGPDPFFGGPDPFFGSPFGPDPFFDPFFSPPEFDFFVPDLDNLFPDPNFVTPVSSPSSPSPGLAVASDVFLIGEFIQLGVADAGSLGSQRSAPSGTITSGPNLGISAIVDLDGFSKGSSAASTRSGDFFYRPVSKKVMYLVLKSGCSTKFCSGSKLKS